MLSVAFSYVPESMNLEELILRKHARFFDIGMNCHHFDLVLAHFQSAVLELGISNETVEEAVQMLLPLRVVFERGVEAAAARQRNVKRHRYISSAAVILIATALALQWRMVRSRSCSRQHIG